LGKIGINPQKDVEISFLPDAEFMELLPTGKVDAIVTYDPFAQELKRKMGDNIVAFSDRGLYTTYGLLVVRDDFLLANPRVVEGVLRSLTEAVLFHEQNRSEAIRLLAKHRGKSLEWLQKEMTGFSWSVELNQSLLLALESEARWRVSLGRSPASQMANYLDLIDEKPLKKVRPLAVSIIR
jgi:ABC-type nitrate/sulfonate/bicarbonate transport system substrate-binding protein